MVFDAKLILLQLLTAGSNYGAQLVGEIKIRTKGRYTLSEGAAYTALNGMRRAGLVTSFVGLPLAKRGGRARRYYELTIKGRKLAEQNREVARELFKIKGKHERP